MTPEERADAVIAAASSGHLGWHGQRALIIDAILAAVAAEREACAREADPGGLSHLFPASPEARARQTLVREVCRKIAAAIRARSEP